MDAQGPQEKASVLSHLTALRKAFVKSAAAVAAAFFVVYSFAIEYIMNLIITPIKERGIEIIYTAMSEAFITKIKVAFLVAMILASPVIIWEFWSFIKPALYPKEKKAFKIIFFVALILFLFGVIFCYGAVYMLAVDFFLVAGDNLATPMLSLDRYVGFLFGFILPFGAAFQLPVFLYITTKIGWTHYRMLASKRKYVILGVFTLAAILTPPDVISQIALGLPMVLLYEAGIQVCRFIN
ncbi:MAG: twin-arginine translocase subunit TatC [Fretibacterium sp.]|nr:twin-arginine translocase subunit TatC [Fretibacterium sp.]